MKIFEAVLKTTLLGLLAAGFGATLWLARDGVLPIDRTIDGRITDVSSVKGTATRGGATYSYKVVDAEGRTYKMHCNTDTIGKSGDRISVMINDKFSTATTEKCLRGKLSFFLFMVFCGAMLGVSIFSSRKMRRK